MAPEPGRLTVGEFAFPGPLRDQLVAAIIAGAKTTTTGLLADYELDAEPLPRPGDRQVVIDSAGVPVTQIEIAEVRVVRVGDIDLAHAVGEGEGYASVAEWRSGHESFWHSREYREYRGDPAFTVNDDTLAVALQFRVLADDHQDLGLLLRRAREAGLDRPQLPQLIRLTGLAGVLPSLHGILLVRSAGAAWGAGRGGPRHSPGRDHQRAWQGRRRAHQRR